MPTLGAGQATEGQREGQLDRRSTYPGFVTELWVRYSGSCGVTPLSAPNQPGAALRSHAWRGSGRDCACTSNTGLFVSAKPFSSPGKAYLAQE